MSSKITVSQSEMVKFVQLYFAKKLFRPSSTPVVKAVRAVIISGNPSPDFEVEVDPPAVVTPVPKPAVAT